MKKILIVTYQKIYNLYINVLFFILTKIYTFPTVRSDENTIKQLIDKNLSIARFGDGEFSIIKNGNIGFQAKNKDLAQRLLEVLYSDTDNLMIGIPRITKQSYFSKLTEESRRFWKREFVLNLDLLKRLNKEKIYYDASTTRPYIRYSDKEHSKKIFSYWKKVWDQYNILIVEGKETRLGVGNSLFSNTKSISRIICPSKNAFDSYDTILETIIKLSEDKLVLIALGPTASILAYDLAMLGIRAIDVGHLDLEYEWYMARSNKRIPIVGKLINELPLNNYINGPQKEEKNYLNEIKVIIKNEN